MCTLMCTHTWTLTRSSQARVRVAGLDTVYSSSASAKTRRELDTLIDSANLMELDPLTPGMVNEVAVLSFFKDGNETKRHQHFLPVVNLLLCVGPLSISPSLSLPL